jgi:hypothetical protein
MRGPLPIREKRPNFPPLNLVNSSKRSNFENRTEWTKSKASERNGPLENNEPVLPIGSPELK